MTEAKCPFITCELPMGHEGHCDPQPRAPLRHTPPSVPRVDVTNKFGTSVTGSFSGTVIAFHVPIPSLLTRHEALVLAAYLVALAEPDPDSDAPRFDEYLDAVLAC